MKHMQWLTLATVAMALQACTHLESPSSDGVALKKEEVAIPFANQRSAVTSWQADGRDGLWVQDGRRDWYYARLNGPCLGLERAIQLGFDTGTSERLDRFAYVIVPEERGQRCAIMSFTRSDPPPEGKRRNLAGEEIR